MAAASPGTGVFIVFDGPDGCGKSTQLPLLAGHLQQSGRTVVTTREPGGTALGEKVRDIVLDPATGDLCAETEMMLFMASRAALVRQVMPSAAAAKRTRCHYLTSKTSSATRSLSQTTTQGSCRN